MPNCSRHSRCPLRRYSYHHADTGTAAAGLVRTGTTVSCTRAGEIRPGINSANDIDSLRPNFLQRNSLQDESFFHCNSSDGRLADFVWSVILTRPGG